MRNYFKPFIILKKLQGAWAKNIYLKLAPNGRGYEQLSVACAMGRIAYNLCYVGA